MILGDETADAMNAGAPPPEHDGGDPVETDVMTLAAALQAHMHENDIDVAALYNGAGGGADLDETRFDEHLRGLPETIGHEEVAFSGARRTAIFRRMDADKDRAINEEECSALFDRRAVCVKDTVITNSLNTTTGITICRVEPGDVLTLFGAQKVDVAGVVR